MSDINTILQEVYKLNDKIISALGSGNTVDADYFAQEVKVKIDKFRSGVEEVNENDRLNALLYANDFEDKTVRLLKPNIEDTHIFEKVKENHQSGIKKTDENVTVLVVDDNELNLEIAEAILKNEGYNVILADTARRAINIFSNSLPGDIQVILTDIEMPGMDGNEMTREIRLLEHNDAKNIKIIALSAIRTDASVKASFAAGMNGYIKKPFDISQFKRILM